MALSVEIALEGCCRLAAAYWCPVISAEVDVGSQCSAYLIVAAVYLIGKPRHFLTVVYEVNPIAKFWFGDCRTIPSVFASRCHTDVAQIFTLMTFVNDKGSAPAFVALLGRLHRIGAIGACESAVGISLDGVARCNNGIFCTLHIVDHAYGEILYGRKRYAHVGQHAEVGLVGNGCEVGRASCLFVDATMCTYRVAEAVNLNNTLVHHQLCRLREVVIGWYVYRYGLCRWGRGEGVLAGA